MRSFFIRIRNFRCQIRNQRPKRRKNWWCGHRTADKMVLTTRRIVATARGTKLKSMQHLVVFREYTVGHLKKNEVLIFGAALGFPHYLVHLMPIGIPKIKTPFLMA